MICSKRRLAVIPREISRTAKERKAGSVGYAEAMLTAYNRKMKNGLKWNWLYAKNGDVPDGSDPDENDAENE